MATGAGSALRDRGPIAGCALFSIARHHSSTTARCFPNASHHSRITARRFPFPPFDGHCALFSSTRRHSTAVARHFPCSRRDSMTTRPANVDSFAIRRQSGPSSRVICPFERGPAAKSFLLVDSSSIRHAESRTAAPKSGGFPISASTRSSRSHSTPETPFPGGAD